MKKALKHHVNNDFNYYLIKKKFYLLHPFSFPQPPYPTVEMGGEGRSREGKRGEERGGDNGSGEERRGKGEGGDGMQGWDGRRGEEGRGEESQRREGEGREEVLSFAINGEETMLSENTLVYLVKILM